MARDESKRLTEKERYWLGHIRSCGEHGTMKSYAAKHDLNLHLFYDWKRRLKRKGFFHESSSDLIFQRVFVKSEGQVYPDCRIKVPSGVIIELKSGCSSEFLSNLFKAAGVLF